MVAVKKSYRMYGEDDLVNFSANFQTHLALSTDTYPLTPVSDYTMGKAIVEFQDAVQQWRTGHSDYYTGLMQLKYQDLMEKLDMQVAYVEAMAPDEDAVLAIGLYLLRPKAGHVPSKQGTSAKLAYTFETNADSPQASFGATVYHTKILTSFGQPSNMMCSASR